MPDYAALKQALIARAREEGFDAVRIADADAAPEAGPRLNDWLAAGHHASMDWMAQNVDRRASPQGLWPEVRSVIMLAMNYGPADDPMALLERRSDGIISAYARNRDYHDIIKGKLKQVAGFLAVNAGAEVKVFVDTAPVMEKPLAQAAGLGWQGKHSVIVSRDHGGWLLLGVIFTTAHLPPDKPERDHCGSCTRCLDICPTNAFPAPYQLDARRCIAYLTIEHKGPIPRSLRPAIGNRVFGCDDCLAVCPWNKFASTAREAKLIARTDNIAPPLAELASLTDAEFRLRFAGSPVKRTGRERFIRNVLIAIGNSRDMKLAENARTLLNDEAATIRGSAVWALSQLLAAESLLALAQQHLPCETDAEVIAEWQLALAEGQAT
ncbi:tRNA epoxyqueuosine(34) reductase QueG [Pseudochelatococcus sp. G4_1912]|uniref:tRNA epoxyqueuosine(34) reductase QueG n=1 Tax=Pseudochelatococcus sp. G4_1912 TaxID=3114288 RepID=UPI0039C5BE19